MNTDYYLVSQKHLVTELADFFLCCNSLRRYNRRLSSNVYSVNQSALQKNNKDINKECLSKKKKKKYCVLT